MFDSDPENIIQQPQIQPHIQVSRKKNSYDFIKPDAFVNLAMDYPLIFTEKLQDLLNKLKADWQIQDSFCITETSSTFVQMHLIKIEGSRNCIDSSVSINVNCITAVMQQPVTVSMKHIECDVEEIIAVTEKCCQPLFSTGYLETMLQEVIEMKNHLL